MINQFGLYSVELPDPSVTLFCIYYYFIIYSSNIIIPKYDIQEQLSICQYLSLYKVLLKYTFV